MESLANIESFVRAAEAGGFSAAARNLGLTPAAVSRNVAQLEGHLGVRLFQRTTRRLSLTEAGERFLASVSGGLEAVRAALAEARTGPEAPSGRLRVSLTPGIGLDYLLPLLPEFRRRYPAVVPDWRFEAAAVDPVGEGYDAAIGIGLDPGAGVATHALAPLHSVAVAAPSYLQGKSSPRHPADLAAHPGIGLVSPRTGRPQAWRMRGEGGEEIPVAMTPALLLNDAEATCRAAVMGLGVALVPLPHVLPHFVSGALVRVAPDWYVDGGTLALHHSGKPGLPAKTRAFVDFVVEQFQKQRLARRFSAV